MSSTPPTLSRSVPPERVNNEKVEKALAPFVSSGPDDQKKQPTEKDVSALWTVFRRFTVDPTTCTKHKGPSGYELRHLASCKFAVQTIIQYCKNNPDATMEQVKKIYKGVAEIVNDPVSYGPPGQEPKHKNHLDTHHERLRDEINEAFSGDFSPDVDEKAILRKKYDELSKSEKGQKLLEQNKVKSFEEFRKSYDEHIFTETKKVIEDAKVKKQMDSKHGKDQEFDQEAVQAMEDTFKKDPAIKKIGERIKCKEKIEKLESGNDEKKSSSKSSYEQSSSKSYEQQVKDRQAKQQAEIAQARKHVESTASASSKPKDSLQRHLETSTSVSGKFTTPSSDPTSFSNPTPPPPPPAPSIHHNSTTTRTNNYNSTPSNNYNNTPRTHNYNTTANNSSHYNTEQTRSYNYPSFTNDNYYDHYHHHHNNINTYQNHHQNHHFFSSPMTPSPAVTTSQTFSGASSSMPLSELRSMARQFGVRSDVGGHDHRTKADMIRDINNAKR